MNLKQNVNKTTALTGPCESPTVSNTNIKKKYIYFCQLYNKMFKYVKMILVRTGFEVLHELESNCERCEYKKQPAVSPQIRRMS